MSKIKQTQRGFNYTNFKDSYNKDCSIQISSRIGEPAIWFGCNKLEIQEFKAGTGWVERTEFDESTMGHHFVGNNRMHLTQSQVKRLLPLLQKFAETGNLE